MRLGGANARTRSGKACAHEDGGTPRKATLPELYEMFFNFAADIEARAEADTKRGLDRTFFQVAFAEGLRANSARVCWFFDPPSSSRRRTPM